MVQKGHEIIQAEEEAGMVLARRSRYPAEGFQDRDVLEEASFLQKDISEGMPRNIEDFKDHPVYVLERHLHRDQVIHPKREVGKVGQRPNSATAVSNLESVYRRQDVHAVKSAHKWFRLGRQLKV